VNGADPGHGRARFPERLKLVIFDNDGTLVPSHEVANPAIQRGFARFCAARGIPAETPGDALLRALTGQPGEVFYRSLLPAEHQDLAPELRVACLDEEVAAMRAHARFYPGLEGLLADLREHGVRLALATHGGERYIGAVADRLDYASLLDRLFYHGFDGMLTKAAMAQRALEDLADGDASSALFAGDRQADREAAEACGIPFIGCAYGYGSAEELAGSAFEARAPEDLALLLRSAASR
jgi:phosphoglycolate phosphatase